MRNPLQSESSKGLGLLAARLPLGVVFVLAGVEKFRSVGGIAQYVRDHVGALPACVPPETAERFLTAVPYAQLALGTLLAVGLLTRISGLLAALLSLAFVTTAGFVNTDYPEATKLFPEPTRYLFLSLVTFFAGPGMFSIDRLLFGRSEGRSE
jgi:uncharacterized membrane protein YphA (DoxX/SURF4 family)